MVAAAEMLRFVADFGIDTLTFRDFAINKGRKQQGVLASNIAVIKVIFGLVVYTLMLIGILVSKYHSSMLLGSLAGLLLLTALWSNLSINYFQSQSRTRELVIPISIMSFVTIILILLSVGMKLGTIVMFATIPFSEVISTILLLKYLRKQIFISKKYLSFPKMKKLVKASFPLAITSILVIIYTRLDILVLGSFSTKLDVGYYGIAYRITEPFQFISAAFAISIYGNISNRILFEKEKVLNAIKKYIAISIVYAISVSLFLFMASPFFVNAFLPKYIPCLPIVNMLSIALAFRIINSCLTSIINAYGEYNKITIVCVWNLIFICLLLYLSRENISAMVIASILASVEFLNMIIQMSLLKTLTLKRLKI
jgi:PST family polysaccharide transporter